MSVDKRKICVVVASRANYGRVKYLLKAIEEHKDLELQLVVGASTLLERFGKAVDIIRGDGFTPRRTIHYIVEGETLTTQAKSTGLGIIEIATAFEDLKPDLVVTVADRFETMATAIAASYMNIPLAHLQGGEITGNIDESVRHAITKLAHIHFPATEVSRNRIIRMGEEPGTVFNHGCPAMDVLRNCDLSISNEYMQSKYAGVGADIDFSKPYFLIVQHPVTTSYGQGRQQVEETLYAAREFDKIQKIVLWPNIDAGTDDVSKGIRIFREVNRARNFHFYKNFSPEDYARILNNAVCLIGNSSSFIREGSYTGVPAVLIGDRQDGREHGDNVVFAGYDRELISTKIQQQLDQGRYASNHIFGDGFAGERIASILASQLPSIKKKLTY